MFRRKRSISETRPCVKRRGAFGEGCETSKVRVPREPEAKVSDHGAGFGIRTALLLSIQISQENVRFTNSNQWEFQFPAAIFSAAAAVVWGRSTGHLWTRALQVFSERQNQPRLDGTLRDKRIPAGRLAILNGDAVSIICLFAVALMLARGNNLMARKKNKMQLRTIRGETGNNTTLDVALGDT